MSFSSNGFFDLFQELGGWLFLGILLSGTIATLLPQDLSQFLVAHDGWTLLMMLVRGIPIYICATASTPIAATLLLKRLSPGAALVFLLAGPATNTATLAVIFCYWGKAVTGVYLFSVATCTLFMGWLTNGLFKALHISAPTSALAAAEESTIFVEPVSAVFLSDLYPIPWVVRKIPVHPEGSAGGQEPTFSSCLNLPGR